MLTATLVLLGAVQSSPVERFTAFMQNAENFSFIAEVKFKNAPYTVNYSLENNRYQFMEVNSQAGRERFWQIPSRILAVNDSYRQYWEYGGAEILASPPPQTDFCSYFYPDFIAKLKSSKALESLKTGESETASGRVLSKLSTKFQTPVSIYDLDIFVDELGVPQRFLVTEQVDGGVVERNYIVKSLHTNSSGLSTWKYEPPVGYTPAEIPYLARPLMSGAPAPLGRWKKPDGGLIDAADLNRKGMVVLFTADDCEPSKKAIPTLEKLKSALDKQGIQLIEIRLGKDAAKLKRSWPVVTDDGKIEKQFGPPVTPYLYVVHANKMILGAWAGYDKDQDDALIASVLGRYKKAAE